MNAHDQIRLRRMLDAAQEALEFAKGATRSTLETEKKVCLRAKCYG
jgi:hypothetical protein